MGGSLKTGRETEFKMIGICYLAIIMIFCIYELSPESWQPWIRATFGLDYPKNSHEALHGFFVFAISVSIAVAIYALLIGPLEYLILTKSARLNRLLRVRIFMAGVFMICVIAFQIAALPHVQHGIQEFVIFFHSHE